MAAKKAYYRIIVRNPRYMSGISVGRDDRGRRTPKRKNEHNRIPIIGAVVIAIILIVLVLLSPTFSPFSSIHDTDGDGTADKYDADIDNDGFVNTNDAFPYDSKEWADQDQDGYGDNSDALPLDPTEWKDSDKDGVGDNSDAFIDDPAEWEDTDGDGIGDNSDGFPEDPSRWIRIEISIGKDTTELNWSIFITSIKGADEIPKYDVFITVKKDDQTIGLNDMQLSRMKENRFYDGVKFIDNRGNNMIDVTDRFIIDRNLYADGSVVTLANELSIEYSQIELVH